jgi:hypothetical protein
MTTQPIRDAVVALAADLCRLSDSEKRRAESKALECLLFTAGKDKIKAREEAMQHAGTHEGFRVAMKMCDALRVRIENGEVA